MLTRGKLEDEPSLATERGWGMDNGECAPEQGVGRFSDGDLRNHPLQKCGILQCSSSWHSFYQ